MSDLVRQAAEHVAPQAARAGVSLRCSVGDVTAWLDGPRLRQALEHLLGNAVRASAPGSVVDVRSASTADLLQVEVEDEGCGIAARDLERVFGAFTRGSSADDRVHGGTGLGLALARCVVEAHGGRLTVSSRVGHGSTFTVALPQRATRRTGA